MRQRKLILNNLVKNSVSAYFAAIEIHNKPYIAYRYETVTLLLMNAWELALKAYVKKYIKKRSIFLKNGYQTISLDKALNYVNEHCNAKKPNSFSAKKTNIEMIEDYRNQVAHYYIEGFEPMIFMLIAKSALNYVEFMKQSFSKDILLDVNLIILPLGFKLPFNPVEFLSHKIGNNQISAEMDDFIRKIIDETKALHNNGIEESIILGFNVYFESAEKVSNSDILAEIGRASCRERV